MAPNKGKAEKVKPKKAVKVWAMQARMAGDMLAKSGVFEAVGKKPGLKRKEESVLPDLAMFKFSHVDSLRGTHVLVRHVSVTAHPPVGSLRGTHGLLPDYRRKEPESKEVTH